MKQRIRLRPVTSACAFLAVLVSGLIPVSSAHATIEEFESRLRFETVDERPHFLFRYDLEDPWREHPARPGGPRDMDYVLRRVTHANYIRLNEQEELERAEVSRSQLRATCSNCFSWDTRNYFHSLRAAVAFFNYDHKNGGWTRREDVVHANRSLVSACAKRAPIGRSIKVRYRLRSVCNQAQHTAFGWTASYDLSRRSDGLHIQLGIRFGFAPELPAHDRMNSYWEARDCLDKAQNFWRRYGIHLAIASDSELHPSLGEIDHVMTLHPGRGRSDLSNLFVGTSHFCATLGHEIGHALGLADEYPEADRCPDRETVTSQREPFSFMAQSHESEVEFFPSHIVQVLEPICTNP